MADNDMYDDAALQKMLDKLLDHSPEPFYDDPVTAEDAVRLGIQTIGLSTEKLLSLVGHLYPLVTSLVADVPGDPGRRPLFQATMLIQVEASWDIVATAESQIRERALSEQVDENDPIAEAMEAVIGVTDNLLPYRHNPAAAVIIVTLNRVLCQELKEHRQAIDGVVQEVRRVAQHNEILYECFLATLSDLLEMRNDLLTSFRTHINGDKAQDIEDAAQKYKAAFLASCAAGITPEDAATQLMDSETGTLHQLTGLGHLGYALRDPEPNVDVISYWWVRRGATALILDKLQHLLNSGLHQLLTLYALATAHSAETGAQVLDALERITGTCMAPLSRNVLDNLKLLPFRNGSALNQDKEPAWDELIIQPALKRWEVFAQTLPEASLARRVGVTGFHTFLDMFSTIERDAQALYEMLETVFVNKVDAMEFMLNPYTRVLGGIPVTVQAGIARFPSVPESNPTRVQKQLQAQYASGIAAGINAPALLDSLTRLGAALHGEMSEREEHEKSLKNDLWGDLEIGHN
jgi:hypothetical protein